MYDPLLLPELQEALLDNDVHAMKEFCEVLYPAVVAENLEALPNADVWRVLAETDIRRQVEIFEYISLHRQRELVVELDRQRLSHLIEEMAADDRVDLLEAMDPEQVELLLPLVAQAERNNIRKLLSYPESSAGSIMTTEYASLLENISVREALTQLRTQAPDRETIYYVYVLDEGRHLRGFISLRKLILSRPETLVSELMERDVISVRVDEDVESVAQKMARYDFIAIPVVDDQARLVGIITHDDVLDVVQEAATEDTHLLGAVQPLEESYLSTPLMIMAWKRVIWLVLLFGAAFLTSSILSHSHYKSISEAHPWIVCFIPLVIASGGNAGSQSATLVIRTLALGEVHPREWTKIAWRETLMGLMLGGFLALVGFLPALWLTEAQGAAVVCVTIALVVIVGTLIGSQLPVLFKHLGMDPALMSNPLVAALVDISGVVLYYNLVRLVFGV